MEGPPTHALADTLAAHLTGHPVERIHVPAGRWQANVLLHNCVGQVIQRIRAHGRWLFLDFSHGVTWATKLLAKAAWTLRLPGEPDRVLPGLPMVSLELRTGVKGCLSGRATFLIMPTESLLTHAALRALGPDPLITPTFDIDFPHRLRRAASRTLAAALVDQDIVAGLGPALRSEILFAAGLAPSARVATLLASDIDALTRIVAKTYADATAAARRHQPVDYAVFDRPGQPCPRCGTDIAEDHTGSDAQPLWFCPACQKIRETPGLFSV